MTLLTSPYPTQSARWPATGSQILAQFDDKTIVVYQAYSKSIGRFAAEHGYFGGSFSFDRMSWIKPNFLWMMYRCGWGTKDDKQETVLAVRLRREGFDVILSEAVHSSFVPEIYKTQEAWGDALGRSSVRMQWDPDHNPYGAKMERRAIQLGMKGPVLAKYSKEWIAGIEDITPFCGEQYEHVKAKKLERLVTPLEEVYPVSDEGLRRKLGISER
jgi:hypothetical protein